MTSVVQAAHLPYFLNILDSSLSSLSDPLSPGPEKYFTCSRYCLVDSKVSLIKFLKHLFCQTTRDNDLLPLYDEPMCYR